MKQRVVNPCDLAQLRRDILQLRQMLASVEKLQELEERGSAQVEQDAKDQRQDRKRFDGCR